MSNQPEESSEAFQESKDLSKNPFVALFPSLQHAKEYIKSTKAGIYISQKETQTNKPEDEQQSLLVNHETSSEWQDKTQIINDFLQKGFLFTVLSDKHKISSKNYARPSMVQLRDLCKEIKEKNGEFVLNSENINQALMERLSSSHLPVISQKKKQSHAEATSPADEPLLIKYLANSFWRLTDELLLLKRKLKDLCVVEELEKLKKECDSLIFSYTGSMLLSPDVFPTKLPHKQFIELLLKQSDCRYFEEYLDGVTDQNDSPDDLIEMFSPAMDVLMDHVKSISLMDPNIFTVLDFLVYFSKKPKLAKVLLSSEAWFPPSRASISSTAGLDYERLTVAGPVIGATTLSYDMNQPSEYFLEPSRQNSADLQIVTNNCRGQIDVICTKTHQMFRNLLENKELHHQVLYWIGSCLHHNRKRAQLSMHTDYGSMLTQARDGFFLNLTSVMLKLCEPFLSLSDRPHKIMKVNSSYCAISSTLQDIEQPSARIHLVQDLEESKIAQRTEEMDVIDVESVQFKFVTECFFLTHACLKIGYLKAFNSYQSLMKRLQKMNDLYRDVRGNGMSTPELDRIKIEFEADIRRQLSFKAHLLNPTLAESVVKFCAATSYWLVQQYLAGKDFNDGKHRDLDLENCKDEVSPAMTIVPEYIAENVADCVIFMSHFGGEILEKSEDILDHIMVFFSIFLRSPNRLHNPHLRAKLAEALAALLPRHQQDEFGVASMRLGGRIFETSEIIPKVLPKSLLQLFVDIEFTGHSMEFEQKFGYRHHMYAVLEYIWKIPSYNKEFWALFQEGVSYYFEKSEFSTFPRFINLLMNDSTFLLDEALQHLNKIREIEKEKDSENWLKLSPEVRQEKERSLFELGEMSRGYNIMANETIHVLSYITKDITRPFASPCMVEQTAGFLNCFLLQLVGPKRKHLKVKDFDKFHFKPGELVKSITEILLNLGTEKDFCKALVSDKRSYSSDLYKQAVGVLRQLSVSEGFIGRLQDFSKKLEEYFVEVMEQECNAPEPPEEFVDPILGTLMSEPVLLPSSKKILDKSTIARHLLSDPKDPFNRSPLTLDMVIPQPELHDRILKWMEENGVKMTDRYTSKDCSG